MLDGIDPLVGDLEWDTWNVLLTLARIWHSLDSGQIVSKSAAAQWAMSRLGTDDAAVLRRAMDWYVGRGEDASAQLSRAARSTAESMLREIRAAVDGPFDRVRDERSSVAPPSVTGRSTDVSTEGNPGTLLRR